MRKIVYLFCAFISTLALNSCNKQQTSVEEKPEVVNISVLNGATGYGASKFIDKASKSEYEINYKCSIETSPDVVKNSLIANSVDIAALPTNNAALIHNSNENLIKVVAINTLSVLYAITTKDVAPITSINELSGKTISIPAAPSYILNAVLKANNITANVETYATPSELLKKVVANQVEYAILPEPLLSTAKIKNDSINVSFDLNDSWTKVNPICPIIQGCVVVRKEFADNYPSTVKKFMEDYKASIEYVKENKDEASKLIEAQFGTVAAAAKIAIDRAGLTYIDGKEMKTKLSEFYNVIKDIEGSNIKGKAPSDSFYLIYEN